MIRFDMENRIVVVTGAAGGLGPDVVHAFQTQGSDVIGVARSSGDFRADLTDAQQATGLVQSIVAEKGRIDVLVHVVGGFAPGSVAATDDATWNRMISTNLTSAFFVIRAVLPHMLEASRGRIIAVGSQAGAHPIKDAAAYSVSKAGLHALIQAAAADTRGTGITVNAVLPSTIDTPANRTWGSPEQRTHWVTPASIAGVIVWLASDAASDVNGALVPVYGGA